MDGSKSTLSIKSDGGLGRTNNAVVLQNGGTLNVSPIASGWFMTNRTVSGTGTLNATNKLLTVDMGSVLIAGETNAVGTLAIIASNLVFNPGSKVMVNLAADTSADVVTVNLKAGTTLTLGGTLDVTTIGGYQPQALTKWVILQVAGGTIQGGFGQVNLPGHAYRLSVTSTNLTVTYTTGSCVMLR